MRTFAISVAAGITVASGMAYALQATSFPPIQSPPQTASDDDRLFHQARDASAIIFDASPEYVARGLEVTTTPQVPRSDLYEGEPAPAEPANGATGPSAVDVESTSAVPSVETTAASGGQSREQ